MMMMIEENLVAAEPFSELWAYDPAKVQAFILDSFANKRKRLSLQTARLWKSLIDNYLTSDNPDTVETTANNFGYDEKNTVKVNLFRLRRESKAFFEKGGEFIPKQRQAAPEKEYDPLTYELDQPLHRKWHRGPQYKMRQKNAVFSSTMRVRTQTVEGGFGIYNEIDVFDRFFLYDHERFKGYMSRLPMPEDVQFKKEPDSEAQEFLRAYEGEHAYQMALRDCLAEKALIEYKRKCADRESKNNPSDLEDRALFPFDAEKRGQAPIRAKERAELENVWSTREKTCITVTPGKLWTITHSKYGSGEILKVNGNTVCCKFSLGGRVNLRVGTILRKTGINLKKAFRLQKILESMNPAFVPSQRSPTFFGKNLRGTISCAA